MIINGRSYGRNSEGRLHRFAEPDLDRAFASTTTRSCGSSTAPTYNAYSRNFSYINGKYAPRMRKMPKPIVLKSSPHASRARAKFG